MKNLLSKLLASLLLVCAGSAQAFYMPVGPQANVSINTVLSGGWTQCYVATMGVSIGNGAESVLNACQGDNIMMAGRLTGNNNLLVLAAADFAEAIFNTGANSSNTHLANGSQWYFANNWSWGFTEASDTVSLNQCDTSNSPLSMCLHTLSGVGGYRINGITGLNNSSVYEKIFFVSNNVPEPATVGLLALSLIGFGFMRRKN